MDFFPIFLNIKGRSCLVVGGGEVAARKVALLRQAGGEVMVVAPELGSTLRESLACQEIQYRPGRFQPADLDERHLVIAATDAGEVNAEVAAEAKERRIPVNVVDQPDLCSFVVPSIIDRSPIVAAVSSGGAAPVLARLLRARLETLIPAAYGRLARLAAEYRQQVAVKVLRSAFVSKDVRQRFLSERRRRSRRGSSRSGSIRPMTASASASSQQSQPCSRISGPPTPANSASGTDARIAAMRPAPSRSPDASPATSPMRSVSVSSTSWKREPRSNS